ncbi:hypothetical protein FA13DRAFT_1801186 [Coprinellus micaceus]|uniref:Nephrocystin 3-like N-terminal domain-containing protein n=1 Tax=Coprinellus micaceus TaxID=71717 RepID=A0A4Y7SGJ2_COPMI|nr:hypothetical protein FA13DRAFT_1801186 [Coprinellus micaceus]
MAAPPMQERDPTASGPSVLSHAHDLRIESLNATTIGTYYARPSPTDVFKYLRPHIAHGAAHNSGERCDAPKCHPETRVAVQEEIMGWITDGERDNQPRRIMWLSGPAGSGKTAIAGSVAEICHEEGLLAASFFFSSVFGSAERRSKRCFIATLASHLAEIPSLWEYKEQLLAAIQRYPTVFEKDLKVQAGCLLIQPFRMVRVGWNKRDRPKVIFIDGLDEVEAIQYHDPTRRATKRTPEDDQNEILQVLLTLSCDSTFPFRIFVASRPESNITNFFTTDAQSAAVRLFLDSKYNPDADVERFLVSKFAQIRRRSGISNQSWPGQPALDRLVEMSSGQFIVPTTIIRWVEAGVPQIQLAELLQFALPNSGTENPFATLDALYRHILLRANNPKDDLHLVVKWIKCITSEESPAANLWRQFLENVEGELNYRLAPITSLISVPPPNDTSSPITIYHKSLTDFLSSPARCGVLYVGNAAHTSFVSERIFVVLKNTGPVVPLPSLPELARFLYSLFYLHLVFEESAEVLTSLSSCSKAELASCDVAWWTRASLSNLLSDGSSLSQDGLHIESSEDWGSYPWLVRLIYHRIHQAMGCGSEAHPLAQDAARQAQGSKCHAACVHWRTGILAKAKELGWCVHELEEVGLDELEHLSPLKVRSMFKSPEEHSCSLCKLASTKA